jgi:type IV pilus assembly protein PilA
MLRTVRGRMRDETGFSLIELLATILILGILAALALTTFIGHKDRSEDTQAKSNARNLMTQVESCYAVNENYNRCNAYTELENAAGMPWGTSPGQVSVTATTARSYEIEAVSVSSLGGTQHVFTIEKSAAGVVTQDCVPAGQGGCPDNGEW